MKKFHVARLSHSKILAWVRAARVFDCKQTILKVCFIAFLSLLLSRFPSAAVLYIQSKHGMQMRVNEWVCDRKERSSNKCKSRCFVFTIWCSSSQPFCCASSSAPAPMEGAASAMVLSSPLSTILIMVNWLAIWLLFLVVWKFELLPTSLHPPPPPCTKWNTSAVTIGNQSAHLTLINS